jgi:DHA1 family multidrug resistance protein-like MFS transporter
MAFVTNVYQLFALRLLLGVFGGFGAMSVALASTLAPRQKVGEAVGLIQATQLGSGIAAPFLGGVIADSVGLHDSFFIASALCLVGFLLITFAFREEREERGAGSTRQERGSLGAYLRLPVFVGLMVTIFTVQFIDRSFGPLLPLYIGTLDAPAERIGSITGLVMTLGALAGSAAAVSAGRLSSRSAPMPLLLGSLACGACLCLPIAFVGHWGQLLVLRVLLGLLAGGAMTLTYAVGGRAMPAGAKIGAFGTLAGIGMIGGAISPLVTGLLSRYASLGAIFVVDAGLYVVVLLWAWRTLARRATAAQAAPARAPSSAVATQAVIAETAVAAEHD